MGLGTSARSETTKHEVLRGGLKMFIALEGIDGCGKSTLAKELAKKYVVTQEPFLSCTTEVISKTKNPDIRELVFYVDRLYHLEQFIIPNLNKTVITDRYKYSQIAYAHARYSGSEIYEKVIELNEKLLEPDIVILLDLPAADALARKPKIKEDISSFLKPAQSAVEFLELVREKYLEIADERWYIIDARQEKKEILLEVLKIIK